MQPALTLFNSRIMSAGNTVVSGLTCKKKHECLLDEITEQHYIILK